MRERLKKGELTREDKQTIVMQIRNKSMEQSRSQMRDRGGRSR